MEPCTSAHCVFAPWLHRGSFISLWMVSRQTSYSAFVRALASCHFGGSKEKVAVKATPLPSLQPHRSILKWGQMTHEPPPLRCTSFLHSLPRSPFQFLPGTLSTFTSTVVHFEGRKLLPDSGTASAPTLWCTKRRETLLSAFKKCHVWTIPMCFDRQSNTCIK